MFKLSTVIVPERGKDVTEQIIKGVDFCSSLNLEGIEPSIPDPFKVDVVKIAKHIKNVGLEASAISTGLGYAWYGWNLTSFNPDIRRKAIEAVKKHVENAYKLESSVIIGLLRGKGGVNLEEELKLLKQALIECGKYAENYSVNLLFEPLNRYETRLINRVDEAVKLLDEINVGSVKLLIDSFHMNIEEACIEESILKAGKYLAYVHVADSNRLAPGKGHIDFKKFLKMLKIVGYRGYLSLEMFLPKKIFEKEVEYGVKYLRTIMEVI